MYENKCNHKRNVDKNVKVWKDNITIEISNMDDKISKLKNDNFELEMNLQCLRKYRKDMDKEKVNLENHIDYLSTTLDDSVHKDEDMSAHWEKEAEYQHYLYEEQLENINVIKHIFNGQIEKLNGKISELKSIKTIMDEYKYKKAYDVNKKKLSAVLTRLNSIKKVCENEDGNLQEVQHIMDGYSGQGDMINKKYSKNELKLARMEHEYQSYMLFLENPQTTTSHTSALKQYVNELNSILEQ